MFRLIRLVILVFLAFAAGTYMQQQNSKSTCTDADGNWRDNTCFIENSTQ